MLLNTFALRISFTFNFLVTIQSASILNTSLAITDTEYVDDFQDNTTILNITIPESTTAPATNQTKRHSSSTIVFPDSLEEPHHVIFPIDTTKCNMSLTYCEDVDTYPYEHLKYILSQQNAEFFGVDEAPIEHRIGEFGDTFLCPAIDQTIFPKAGKNKYNKWKYIINQGDQDKYVQGVRIETCAKYGGPCNLLGSAPYGYVTSCTQKYIYRRMLSISESGMPTPDTFQLPSACCCSYRRDDGYLLNFGKKFSPK